MLEDLLGVGLQFGAAVRVDVGSEAVRPGAGERVGGHLAVRGDLDDGFWAEPGGLLAAQVEQERAGRGVPGAAEGVCGGEIDRDRDRQRPGEDDLPQGAPRMSATARATLS